MRIVVGVDPSEGSKTVLERAVAYARAFGASLDVVHVFETPRVYDLGAAIDIPLLRRAESEAVWAQLDQVLKQAEGVDVERHELTGGAAPMIVRHAEERHADLIIVGNRGRGDLASLVLGSTSHGVIHSAPCDVVVIRTG